MLSAIFLIFNNLVCQEINDIDKYVTFLETQNKSAKNYVLDLFNKYDIVVLCERNHCEMTQYDLIYDIVSSDYFKKNVGHIFTETGSIDNRENVLKFLKTKFTNQEEKLKQQLLVYRNIRFPYWEKTNFYNFIGLVNTLNSTLIDEFKINIFVSDCRNPTKEETSSTEMFKKYFDSVIDSNRDSIMASNIILTYDSLNQYSNRKKCLIIMNYRHAFSKSLSRLKNVGHYLSENYKGRFANVYINSFAPTWNVEKSDKNKPKIYQNMTQIPIQDGKWDAAFKVAKKDNIGFDFNNSPFGSDYFDIWPFTNHNLTYSDIFTGFVYYLPIDKHYESIGIKNIIDGYLDELYARNVIWSSAFNIKPNKKKDIKNSLKLRKYKNQELGKHKVIINRWIKK